MPYATYAQFEEAYHFEFLQRIALRAGESVADAVVQARCEASLLACSGIMDGYLNRVYAVPVSSPLESTAAALRDCCMALAVSDLIGQKGYVEGSEDASLVDGVAKRYLNKPNGWLYLIASGTAVLPGAADTSSSDDIVAPSQGWFVTSEEPFYPPADTFR